MASWMVGIDTGGSFTDLIAFDPDTGERRIAKVPSRPDDPSAAVMNALDELFQSGVDPGGIEFLVHGTTVATNAILENRGARTGLLITRGFRAVYEGRGWSQPAPEDLADPYYVKPPLLAPQSLTEEITERLDYLGNVQTPLDEDDARRAIARLKEKDVEAVAINFLFSFRNPEHEERTAALIAEMAPEWRVSVSSRILPTIREYPRLSTTVIDAFVGRSMETYLLRLVERLRAAGIVTPQIFLMQSNGGLMRMNVGARYPNQTLLSGPAAGVVSGIELAARPGTQEPRHLRHGRHLHRYQCDPRRAVRGDHRGPDRGTGPRDAHAGGPHPGCGRRHHRLDREGRPDEGRAPERGRRPGSGLLRQGRRAADGDRRQPAAGRPRGQQRPGRAAPAGPDPCGGGRCARAWPNRWASTWCRRRPGFSRSSTTTWRWSSGSRCNTAASIRATSCWSPSAAPDRFTPACWPRSSGCPRFWCRRIPASTAPWDCSRPRSGTFTCNRISDW